MSSSTAGAAATSVDAPKAARAREMMDGILGLGGGFV